MKADKDKTYYRLDVRPKEYIEPTLEMWSTFIEAVIVL